MGIDISVRFEDVKRGPANSVTGKVALKVSGEVLGQKFDQQIDARNFDFPQGGEKQIYDEKFGVVKVTASVNERTAGQCCLVGHVHADVGIGGGIGADIPGTNCTPIPG